MERAEGSDPDGSVVGVDVVPALVYYQRVVAEVGPCVY